MHCEGQGEGDSSPEGEALGFSTSTQVHAPAMPAGRVGLLKYLTRCKIMLHVQFQN